MHNPTSSPRGPARSGMGSQSAWRRRNLERLIEDLRANGPATQRQLAERTGFSTATISNLVKILLTEQRVQTQPTISSGRRSVLVETAK